MYQNTNVKETAKLKGNVDNEIPVERVYRYLRDLSYEYCKKNPPTLVNKSIDKNKLDLGSLCHYLQNNAIPGFEEPFEEPVIHLMFQVYGVLFILSVLGMYGII